MKFYFTAYKTQSQDDFTLLHVEKIESDDK